MKFILKIGLLLFLPLLVWNCDSEMMDYEGKDGVYFMMQTPPQSGYGEQERWEYVDTTLINFSSVMGNDIPVLRIGTGKKEVFYSASIHR